MKPIDGLGRTIDNTTLISRGYNSFATLTSLYYSMGAVWVRSRVSLNDIGCNALGEFEDDNGFIPLANLVKVHQFDACCMET